MAWASPCHLRTAGLTSLPSLGLPSAPWLHWGSDCKSSGKNPGIPLSRNSFLGTGPSLDWGTVRDPPAWPAQVAMLGIIFVLGSSLPTHSPSHLGLLPFLCPPDFLPGCGFLNAGSGPGSHCRAHGIQWRHAPSTQQCPCRLPQVHKKFWTGWGMDFPSLEASLHLPLPD